MNEQEEVVEQPGDAAFRRRHREANPEHCPSCRHEMHDGLCPNHPHCKCPSCGGTSFDAHGRCTGSECFRQRCAQDEAVKAKQRTFGRYSWMMRQPRVYNDEENNEQFVEGRDF